MITCHTGSFQTLRKTLIDDISQRKRAAPMEPVLVISPSQRQLDFLSRLLLQRNPALFNIYFQSFYGVAQTVLNEQPAIPGHWIQDSYLLTALIQSFLEGNGDEPFVLREAFTHGNTVAPGLAASLAATLRDLRDAGANPAACLRTALEGNLGDETRDAAPLLELYARVESILKRQNLLTSADRLKQAAEILPNSKWIASQKAVYLFGFYDLTGVQLDFVNSFSRHSNAHLYVPYLSGDPRYAYVEKLLEEPSLQQKVSKASDQKELVPESAKPTIEAWSCSGAQDEIWLACKTILKWVHQGASFDQIAVIARNWGSYLPSLQDELKRHEISFVLFNETPCQRFPLFQFIHALFTLEREGYSRQAVSDIFESAYFKARVPVPNDLKENLPPFPGWDLWELYGIREEQTKFIETLRQLKHDLALPKTDRWEYMGAWAKNALDRWLAVPAHPTYEEAEIHSSVLDLLDSFREFDRLNMPVTPETFLETLLERLDSLTIPLADQRHSGVSLLTAQQARGLSFENVLVLGLNERSFPRLIREDPFLSDAARKSLTGSLGVRLTPKLDGYAEERLLFHLVTDLAETRLALLTQRSDEEGKAQVSSLYLTEFLKKQNVPVTFLPRSWKEKTIEISGVDLTPKEMSLLISQRRGDMSSLTKALKWPSAAFLQLERSQQSMESFDRVLTEFDAVVGPDPRVHALLEGGISPTALEDLTRCGFQYFAGNVLRLRPKTPIEDRDFYPQHLGKTIHKVLENFFKIITSPGVVPEPAVWKNTVSELIDQERDAFYWVYPTVWKSWKTRMQTALERFLETDLSELKASGYWPAFRETELSGMQTGLFKGRVDRIDIRQTDQGVAVRVVDYKSRLRMKNAEKLADAILQGQTLQLPVYISLAKEFVERELGKPVKSASGFLYPVFDEGAPLGIDESFFKEHQKDLDTTLTQRLIQIREGRFPISPAAIASGVCSRCEFIVMCRKEHMPTWWRSDQVGEESNEL